MKQKRWLAMFCAVTLGLAGIGGCGKGEIQEPVGAAASDEAEADTVETQETEETREPEGTPEEGAHQEEVEAQEPEDASEEGDRQDEAEAQEPEPIELTEQTVPLTEQYVKLLGRTQTENDILWLAQSASGVAFTFTGTKAVLTVAGDASGMAGSPSKARFAVYVNGERTLDELVDAQEKTYDLFSSETEAETEIRIIKLSESANSTFGIKQIDVTSAGAVTPLPQKEMKIEFIGDSITCGYGVDDEEKSHHFSTETEDATKTYAYKTAEALDADYSFVSYSGHGVISGYSGNGEKVDAQTVPPIYGQFAKTYGSANGYFTEDAPWDFTRFVPDIIVVNLGTNDDSYTKSDADKKEDFTVHYVEFLKQIRQSNPDAVIVCALGVMGANLYPDIEDAVSRYQDETGDTRVSAFKLPAQDGSTGYAADWHPTEATHEIVAEALTAYLRGL